MLREFVEKKHVKFADSAPDWREAIRMSCEVLEADGTIEENYKEDIIACVEKYGPYIVIVPGIAMPHSTEGAVGCNGTAISFMKVEEEVDFDPEDPDKRAKLFFSLAAIDHDQHIQNIQSLMDTLMNEDIVEALMNAKTKGDLEKIANQYE